MSTERGLVRATALVVFLAAIPAGRVPAFPTVALLVLGVLAAWRFAAGADGRELVGPRMRFLLQSAASAAVLVLLLVSARGSTSALVAILLLVSTVQAVSLLGRQTPTVLFRLIVLSTTQVAGAAFVIHDAVALGLLVLYMVALLTAVLFFERHLTALRSTEERAAREHVRVASARHVPRAAWVAAVAIIALIGTAVAGAIYLVAPRNLAVLAGTGAARDDAVEAEEVERAAASAEDGGGAFTGPDVSAQGIRLGDVGRIKKDLTPYFEVSLPPGRRPFLRENTYDHYGGATWTMSRGDDVRDPERLQAGAGGAGWIPLGSGASGRTSFHLGLRLYRGTHRRLYLERDCDRLRVLRGGRVLPTALWRLDNEQLDSVLELEPEDRIEARIVPPPDDPALLVAARSDATTAPRASFLQLPEVARPLATLAREVVGRETNPYRRAELLIRWFASDAFTYTLNMPEVDTASPVVDFVTRVRRGHCEYFASGLTLMLRALGHPARIVKGFRGGDAQEGRGTWIVRGSHYHAWTEMHFEGLGWIALDATPPDAAAIDAESVTREAGASESGGTPWLSRFLGYGVGDHEALLAAFVRGLDRLVARPVAWLFGGWRLYLMLPLLALLVALGARGRQRRRLAARAGVASTAELTGPYGAMLALLAKRGIRRPRHVTPREFAVQAARRLPTASEALADLTDLHEAERYACRRPDDDAGRRARERIRELKLAVESDRRNPRVQRT